MRTMKKNRLLLLVCFVLLIIFFVALSNGAATVGKADFWQALFDFDRSKQSHQIIRNIRLPRVAGAFLVGSCFALSGALMQGVTRNPLADSGLLGINAGASLAMALSFAFWPKASDFSVFLMSLAGSFAVTLLVFAFLLPKLFENGHESFTADFSWRSY
ncbi:hypothetical protein EfmAA55_17470 [Enterococcus faecium]|nr:hypothetical protein EfmAA55_17470 [Enterococcus faecium]